MTNPGNTVLYVGVTNDICRRTYEHKHGVYPRSFTHRYVVVKLVYYEEFYDVNEAIAREKQLKGGSRQKKLDLVNTFNPGWKDLYFELCT